MTAGDRYLKLVEWSDDDGCFVGSCPELIYGGCHGADAKAVFAELCDIIDETIALYEAAGRALPDPLTARDFVSALQSSRAKGA